LAWGEPLVASLRGGGARILATDMAPDEASQNGWADTATCLGQDALNERNLCPPDMFDALVDFDVRT
jgi:hypothetical protein